MNLLGSVMHTQIQIHLSAIKEELSLVRITVRLDAFVFTRFFLLAIPVSAL